jgi:hypothetical protein
MKVIIAVAIYLSLVFVLGIVMTYTSGDTQNDIEPDDEF